MTKWSLTKLLEGMHDDIYHSLDLARNTMVHPVSKGDASEKIWLEWFQKYLPKRYQAEKAHVVDSKGNFSQQMDVVIFDRQYSPFIFDFSGEKIIPAESVYAVFEAKQSINANLVNYAQEKIDSVRNLHRTSLPIPHAGGTYPAKQPCQILGGILAFESEWKPELGDSLRALLAKNNGCLNMGCVVSHGYFNYDASERKYDFFTGGKPATAFLFKLISQLQVSGTVSMIDVLAYSKWIGEEPIGIEINFDDTDQEF